MKIRRTILFCFLSLASALSGAELVTSAPWQSWTKTWTFRAKDSDVSKGGWATLRFKAEWTDVVSDKGRENYRWSGVVVSVKAKGKDGQALFPLTKNFGVGTQAEKSYSFRFLVPRDTRDFTVDIGPFCASGKFVLRSPELSLAPFDAKYPTREHKGKFYEYDERGRAPANPAALPMDGLALFHIHSPRMTFDRFAPEAEQVGSVFPITAGLGETVNVYVGLYAGRDLALTAEPKAFVRKTWWGLFSETLATSPSVLRAHNRPKNGGRGQTYWIAPQTLVPFESCNRMTRGTTAQAVIQFRVPANAKPGDYEGSVAFSDGGVCRTATIRLSVLPIRVPFPDVKDYEEILHVGWYGDDPVVLKTLACDAKRRGTESLLIACQYGKGMLKLRERNGRLEIESFDRFDHALAAFKAAGMRGTLFVHFSDKLEVAVARAIGAVLPDAPGEQTNISDDMKTDRFRRAQAEALKLVRARAGGDLRLAVMAMDEPDGRGREPRCRYEIARIKEAGLVSALYGGGPSYRLVHPDVIISQERPFTARYDAYRDDASAHGARICRYGGSGSYGHAFGGLMPSRLLHGWGEYLMPESNGHTIWTVQTQTPYDFESLRHFESWGSVYERMPDGRLVTTLELEGCYEGFLDYAYLKELDRRLAAHAGEAKAARIAADLAALKTRMMEVIPYRLNADTILDFERELKKPFTNADAVAVREKMAAWLMELEE